MKYIGQRGIQSAISSQALLSSNFMQQLNIVLPPIMDTLTDDNKPQLNQLKYVQNTYDKQPLIYML